MPRSRDGFGFAGTLRFIALTLIATIIAGAIAYATVRMLTREASVVGPIDRGTLAKARAMRSFNNELVGLLQRYELNVPSSQYIPPDVRRWVADEFNAELRGLRARLDVIPNPEHAFQSLDSAAEQMAYMSAHPEDPSQRDRARQEIERATANVQTQIEAWDAERLLGEPLRKLE